jgi:hypothetical protein
MGKAKTWARAWGIDRVPDFVGGAIGRGTGTALLIAAFLIITGMTPGQFLAFLWNSPPAWLMSGWTRLIFVILGLALIYGSLRANVWSQQQRAVNEIAEDISWAIHHLLNQPLVGGKPDALYLRKEYDAWCQRVSDKLSNSAFFTLADKLHFDRLGFIEPVQMTGQGDYDWILSQLRLKFDRARDVINWVQQRRR